MAGKFARISLSLFARAATTEGFADDRNGWPHGSGGQKPEVKVLRVCFLPRTLSSKMSVFSLCPAMVFPLCMSAFWSPLP